MLPINTHHIFLLSGWTVVMDFSHESVTIVVCLIERNSLWIAAAVHGMEKKEEKTPLNILLLSFFVLRCENYEFSTAAATMKTTTVSQGHIHCRKKQKHKLMMMTTIDSR